LDPTEFRRLARHGLGHAVLHLQQTDPAPFREIVFEACLTNDVYDQQVHGNRSKYLWDLVRAMPDHDAIASNLIDSIAATEHVPYWIVGLLKHFTVGGNEETRSFLRSALLSDPTDWSLIDANIELDGWTGVLLVSRLLERLPADDDDARDAAKHATWTAERRLGKDFANPSLLSRASGEDSGAVAAMVARAHRKRAKTAKSTEMTPEERRRRVRLKDPSIITFKDVWSTVEEQVPTGRVRSTSVYSDLGHTTYRDWGQHASEIDIQHAAYELVAHAPIDVARIARYAQIFAKRSFPLDPSPLFDIVNANIESAERDYWKNAAGWALHGVLLILSQLNDPRVRELALELRQRTDWWKAYWIWLLLPTYGPGDQPDVEAAIQIEADEQIVHGWGMEILDFCEREPREELIPSLLLLYERTRCALCRGEIVKLLHRLNSLPDSIVEECRYDSDERTREFVASLKG
jgi:hypothetical protein